MDLDSAFFSLFILELIVVFVLVRRFARIPRTFVLDYQRGVRFVNGAFADIVGPGRYLGFNKNVQIQVVDMRPRQFVMECISYRDALRNDSFISVGAEMVVFNPYLAATKLKDQFTDSIPTVRDTLRSVASRGLGDGGPDARSRTARDVTEAVNRELQPSGMKVENLEITEMWSRPSVGRTSLGLN